jgi:hypothetical protein
MATRSITTCRKHTEPFKRREKLAQHIRTFHPEITEGQDVNGGISSGERDAALTTSNAANTGNHFGGNYRAARMSARAHHDSDEVGAWYSTVLGEPIDVQSAPVANSCEMGLCYVCSQILQQWKTFRANILRLQIYQQTSISNLTLLQKSATGAQVLFWIQLRCVLLGVCL